MSSGFASLNSSGRTLLSTGMALNILFHAFGELRAS